MDRCACGEGDDLIENISKLDFKLINSDKADMRCRRHPG